MNIAAELTLQIARLLHERPDPPRSPARWHFWPTGREGTWADAREFLAAAPKPLMVSPAQLRFEAATPVLTIGMSEFIEWAGQYALNAGVSVRPTETPGVARIVVRPTEGNGPPLGMRPDPYALRA